jgi:regulator of sigma E protease
MSAMDILIFIIVLVVLIVVHELGHFIVAKWSGMRVDEFGLGYPPRALVLGKKNGTTYTLNWLPFGGFVKIHGEDPSTKAENDIGAGQAVDSQAFSSKNRFLQALVLVAGIAMNILLAYVLIVGVLLAGTPRALSYEEMSRAQDARLAVLQVLPGTPAEKAGVRAGDAILSAEGSTHIWDTTSLQTFPDFIAGGNGEEVTLSIQRGTQVLSLSATPLQNKASRYLLGVEVTPVGTIDVSFFEALTQGAVATWNTIVFTAKGLVEFFVGVFTFSADLASVAGPIGIAGVVGSAYAEGFSSLLTIAAIISINLALINLIPIPALDGGRLLFVIIESVTRKPIRASVSQGINAVGFFLLLLLMIVVSVHDIWKIVG